VQKRVTPGPRTGRSRPPVAVDAATAPV
jgi:hypothetical protein